MELIDFSPATGALAALVRGVREDQLAAFTPCPAYDVADLLDHIGGFTLAFPWAASKTPAPVDGPPQVDGSRLEQGFRDRIARDLDALARAWHDPAAYDGLTRAGGIDLPAEVAALVALDEVVVHGWDLARATGQDYAPAQDAVLPALAFAQGFEAPSSEGGPFGPPVAVADTAPALDRLVAATGRDPRWRPVAG
jgi:uncharacterized protein (TIGR03086 family)